MSAIPPVTLLISKPDVGRRKFKVHALHKHRPLCGGGRLARLVQAWQSEIGTVTCERCKRIMERLCKSAT